MLNNATGFKKIYLATGFTDLRRGIEGLASIVKFQFNLDPYDKDTLFCFVVEEAIELKRYYGKVMDSCLCISD